MSGQDILTTFAIQLDVNWGLTVEPPTSSGTPLSQLIASSPDRFGARLQGVNSGAITESCTDLYAGLQPNYDDLVRAPNIGSLDRLAETVTHVGQFGFSRPEGHWVAYDKTSQRPVAESEDPGEAITLARAKGARLIRIEYVRKPSASSQIGL